MCRAAGCETVVAGNIGLPVLDALAAVEDGAPQPEVFVLELSSFQLESTVTLAPDAAAMLNLTEDHMDRYDGLADYAAAKSRVFNGNGVQVLNRDDRWSLGMARAGRTIFTFGRGAPEAENGWGIADAGIPALLHGTRRLLALDELPVAGLHNAANALAAHALCSALGLPDAATAAALKSYAGLPHRLEKVAVLDGVALYDDSKGTNVGATVAALSGMTVPVVLIAGGDGKGQDFAPLAAAVAGRAREVVLIGRDAEAIARALAGSGVRLARATDMEEAVLLARAATRPGDAVLLSPACASFDMFRNYVHRGEVFVAAVRALGRRGLACSTPTSNRARRRPSTTGASSGSPCCSLALGLVMVYSASIAIAEGSRSTGYQPGYFLARHALFAVAWRHRGGCWRSRCRCGSGSRRRRTSSCSASASSRWCSCRASGAR